MPEFNDLVIENKQAIGLEKKPPPLPEYKPRPSGIYCLCRFQDLEHTTETWPELFKSIPNKGDCVRSLSGTKLIVIDIVHSIDNDGNPIIELELGRLSAMNVSPTTGDGVGTRGSPF